MVLCLVCRIGGAFATLFRINIMGNSIEIFAILVKSFKKQISFNIRPYNAQWSSLHRRLLGGSIILAYF